MKIKITRKEVEPRVPKIGELFMYDGFDNIYMGLFDDNHNGTNRCVDLENGRVYNNFCSSGITLLKQLNELEVAPV